MTVLADFEIAQYCNDPIIKLIEPFDPDLINPNSIDLTIGVKLLEENTPCCILDEYWREHPDWRKVDLSQYTIENPYRMQPGQFVLVETAETFNIPEFLCGEFRLKSSRAREGWDNALAVWLDSGWHGSKLTLELKNNRQHKPLPLYPGLRIGQAIFFRNTPPKRHYGETGRYNNDQTVMSSKG
jgi:dCTP deaminase